MLGHSGLRKDETERGAGQVPVVAGPVMDPTAHPNLATNVGPDALKLKPS
jgi:hypothetical protein